MISLSELREQQQLSEMKLLQRGNRLSVLPLSKDEWDFILSME
jgi:predicted RNA-binding protein with PUA-like domain